MMWLDFVKNDILVFSLSVISNNYSCAYFLFSRNIRMGYLFAYLSSAYSVIVIFGMLGLTQIEVTAISSNFSALIFILSISMNIQYY